MPRDNFSPAIKNSLALRAGYLCSMCKKLTVGPSEESKKSVSKTGTAAHIYGAARGHLSRRQDDSISSTIRSSIENGIWVCNNHATLIDRDEDTYTAKQLIEVKLKHEEYVKLLNSGVNVSRGIIRKIEIGNLPFAGSNIEMDLSEKSLIIGNNGVGKTMMCELIKSLTDKTFLNRWLKRVKSANAFCNIHFYKEEEDKYTIELSSVGSVSYCLNDAGVPFLRSPLHIFYLYESLYSFKHRIDPENKLNTLDAMAKYFGLETHEFTYTINSMRYRKKMFTTDIFVDKNELIVNFEKREGRFESFSGGEKQRILMDIITTIANYHAKFSSTVLIIEQGTIGIVDTNGVNFILDTWRYENLSFQIILTLLAPASNYNLEGYTVGSPGTELEFAL